MDLDERKQREAKIEYMAYYDMLTDLPNKAYFIEKLNSEIEKAGVEAGLRKTLIDDELYLNYHFFYSSLVLY